MMEFTAVFPLEALARDLLLLVAAMQATSIHTYAIVGPRWGALMWAVVLGSSLVHYIVGV